MIASSVRNGAMLLEGGQESWNLRARSLRNWQAGGDALNLGGNADLSLAHEQAQTGRRLGRP